MNLTLSLSLIEVDLGRRPLVRFSRNYVVRSTRRSPPRHAFYDRDLPTLCAPIIPNHDTIWPLAASMALLIREPEGNTHHIVR